MLVENEATREQDRLEDELAHRAARRHRMQKFWDRFQVPLNAPEGPERCIWGDPEYYWQGTESRPRQQCLIEPSYTVVPSSGYFASFACGRHLVSVMNGYQESYGDDESVEVTKFMPKSERKEFLKWNPEIEV